MKFHNLLAVQQRCMPPKERSNQNILKITSLAPLVLGVVMLFPAIGNPEALFSSLSMFVYLLLLSVVLYLFIKQIKKKYLKRFTSEQLGRIDKECLSAPHYEGLMVTSDALMYFMPAILALPVQELVWVYPTAVTHQKGLLSKTYYQITAVTKDKKKHVMLRENMDQERVERSMAFLNEHLKKSRPHLLMGYSKELATMLKKDFNRMVQMAD